MRCPMQKWNSRISKTIRMNKKFTLSLATILLACTASQANAFRGTISASHENTLYQKIAATKSDLKSAEKTVQNFTDSAISFISDENLSQAQKTSKFKSLLIQNFDIKSIARFSLGKYWRQTKAEQKTKYLSSFQQMIIKVYSSRFSDYNGQKLSVTGSREQGKRDMLVHSLITQENGPDIKIDWRLRKKNGRNQIIDIIVEGVSMALTQRSDFDSVIQRGGGKVQVLLDHLD